MAATAPIRVHPDNPHYFEYEGKPLLLISSADIYYDIYSPHQDYIGYLDLLARYSSNFTRIYPAGCTSFPPQEQGQYILPWVKLDNGKYDLDRWNPEFFRRLHHFMEHAQRKGIIVDVCLFNGFCTAWAQINNYCWPQLPWNIANNIQGEGSPHMNEFTSLIHASNVKRQKEYIRKIVQELDRYNNVIYDTSDEPDCFGNLPIPQSNAWVEAMLSEICASDTRHHLVAQTHIPPLESTGKDWCRDPRTTWLNAEYLCGLLDFEMEYPIDKPYVLIETHSPGEDPGWERWWDRMGLVMTCQDKVSASRIHAWAFMVAGGGGFMEWSANYCPGTPGTIEPQPTVLQQKKVLREFLEGFDFARMRSYKGFSGVHQKPALTETAWATAIAEPGKQYALYLSHSFAACKANEAWYGGFYAPTAGSHRDTLTLEVPPGTYRVEWVEPATGKMLDAQTRVELSGAVTLQTPTYAIDIALRMLRA
jgi:hypothetical protein